MRGWAGAEVGKVHRLGRLDPDDLAQQILLKVFERFREEPFFSATGTGGSMPICAAASGTPCSATPRSEALYRGINLDPELWKRWKLCGRVGGPVWHGLGAGMAIVREAVDRSSPRRSGPLGGLSPLRGGGVQGGGRCPAAWLDSVAGVQCAARHGRVSARRTRNPRL